NDAAEHSNGERARACADRHEQRGQERRSAARRGVHREAVRTRSAAQRRVGCLDDDGAGSRSGSPPEILTAGQSSTSTQSPEPALLLPGAENERTPAFLKSAPTATYAPLVGSNQRARVVPAMALMSTA